MDKILDIMKSIEIAVNIGAFENKNELRKATQQVFSFLTEKSELENKKVERIDNKQPKTNAEERLMEYNRRKTDS